jgi:hypothetical protein
LPSVVDRYACLVSDYRLKNVLFNYVLSLEFLVYLKMNISIKIV